jgi:16S rRNA (cytosine1402-N4)-methyltransferase
LGFDRDGTALEAATGRLAEFAGRFELIRANYADMKKWVRPASVAGVLLDLGISSFQLESESRGFGFSVDGPLDMRFDERQSLTAAELVNSLSADELADVFWRNADEPAARRISRAIVNERRNQRLETTRQLAALVERICPRHGRKAHPATRVFQALRVEVNDELGSLRTGLAGSLRVLEPGGRLLVLSFDSLQDRITKHFMREHARDYDVVGEVDRPEFRRERVAPTKLITRKAILPSDDEVAANPRARSAQLRILEKV